MRSSDSHWWCEVFVCLLTVFHYVFAVRRQSGEFPVLLNGRRSAVYVRSINVRPRCDTRLKVFSIWSSRSCRPNRKTKIFTKQIPSDAYVQWTLSPFPRDRIVNRYCGELVWTKMLFVMSSSSFSAVLSRYVCSRRISPVVFIVFRIHRSERHDHTAG